MNAFEHLKKAAEGETATDTETAVAARMATNVVAAAREALRLLDDFISDIGGCDHSVGICACGARRTRDDLAIALHPFYPDGPDEVVAPDFDDPDVMPEAPPPHPGVGLDEAAAGASKTLSATDAFTMIARNLSRAMSAPHEPNHYRPEHEGIRFAEPYGDADPTRAAMLAVEDYYVQYGDPNRRDTPEDRARIVRDAVVAARRENGVLDSEAPTVPPPMLMVDESGLIDMARIVAFWPGDGAEKARATAQDILGYFDSRRTMLGVR